MPTIQLYKGGTKVVEHIAAEGAIDALEKVWSLNIHLCEYPSANSRRLILSI